MAHGVSEGLGEGSKMVTNKQPQQQQQHNHLQQQPQQQQQQQQSLRKSVGVMGSRRIFAPAFKLRVLDSYRNDIDCRGNQRATARKYGIHRRQIQKWLQCEDSLRSCCAESSQQQHQQQQQQQQSPKEVIATETSHQQQQQHQHHQQQPNDNGSPASPALNLSLARLHGDELVAQQQQQPPPPPPPPPSAQTLAASQQQPQPQQPTSAATANYRFHATATVPGYPKRLPFLQHFSDYTMLEQIYQPSSAVAAAAAVTTHQHQQQRYEVAVPNNFQQPMFETPVSSLSPTSIASSPSLHSEDEEQHQRRSMQLLAPADIKIERASPELLLATPPFHSPVANNHQIMKKEDETDEEEFNHHHRRATSSSSGSSSAGSPVPSHQHLDSLPDSPRDSERLSSGSSSESELEQQAGSGAAELARRRSFSLRFKLDVLDAFHHDPKVAGNQRATARKFGINRRQVQKWLGQESELRGVIELCGSRQRLGPLLETATSYPTNTVAEEAVTPRPTVAVDLRTASQPLATELGQLSPHYGCCDYYSPPVSSSPPQPSSNYTVDPASLTPPYSTPGCSLSCCQEQQPQTRPYYCYSPAEPTENSNTINPLKRSLCTQSCCYTPAPAAKKVCIEEKQQQPIQETPLCLVKPKKEPEASPPHRHQVERVSSTVPSPPIVAPPTHANNKKDAILFKPYLDNPVSKPTNSLSPGLNNNCQDICNLNERPRNHQQADLALELSFKLPLSWRAQQHQQLQSQYLDFPHVRSAFVRYPAASAHYS